MSKYLIAILLVAALSISSCDNTGSMCRTAFDTQVRLAVLDRCMSIASPAASPDQHTTNMSETHEIFRTCSNISYSAASYDTCNQRDLEENNRLRKEFGLE